MAIKHHFVKVEPTGDKQNIIMCKPKFANSSSIVELSVILWVRANRTATAQQ
jgi:hypothetical protein